jgi:catechol 2,3-dioxygenase-like lactoylglutathione lyase family enzyme
MAKIRHIAIATNDPEATARFYRHGLGLQDAGRVFNDLAEGYYLTRRLHQPGDPQVQG